MDDGSAGAGGDHGGRLLDRDVHGTRRAGSRRRLLRAGRTGADLAGHRREPRRRHPLGDAAAPAHQRGGDVRRHPDQQRRDGLPAGRRGYTADSGADGRPVERGLQYRSRSASGRQQRRLHRRRGQQPQRRRRSRSDLQRHRQRTACAQGHSSARSGSASRGRGVHVRAADHERRRHGRTQHERIVHV